MFFEVDHLTLYRYSVPVQLGPHTLRFLPLQRPGQQPGRCELQIDPQPVRTVDGTDFWGNHVVQVEFQGETDKLEILARLQVETGDPLAGFPPQDFPLQSAFPGEQRPPASYFELLEVPFALRSFIESLEGAAMGSGMHFLHELNRAIHGFYHQGVRLDGPPRSPAETLARGEGVCRDLTLLFMAVCRQQGLAARFVSGYQRGEGRREVRYLHAWPEVYLPGSGWLGFDPTHESVVGADHLAVAAGPTPASVTPVEGGYTFIGSELNSTLLVDIHVAAHPS